MLIELTTIVHFFSGKIMLETILLLADSSVLPINVEDYVVEIQAAFGNFMTHYQEDFHKANLSIGKNGDEIGTFKLLSLSFFVSRQPFVHLFLVIEAFA